MQAILFRYKVQYKSFIDYLSNYHTFKNFKYKLKYRQNIRYQAFFNHYEPADFLSICITAASNPSRSMALLRILLR